MSKQEVRAGICDRGSALAEIGAETSEQLSYIPVKIQMIRHVRPKYACSHCRTGTASSSK